MADEQKQGLLVYGIDNDELAIQIGQRLEKNPPNNIIVERFPKSNQDEDYKAFIKPKLKEIIKRKNTRLYIELKSETMNELPYREPLSISIGWGILSYPTNMKLRNIIEDYYNHYDQFMYEELLPISGLRSTISKIGRLSTYHGLVTEFWNIDIKPLPKIFSCIGEILLRDLCDFIYNRY
jgi:hypothetical protein